MITTKHPRAFTCVSVLAIELVAHNLVIICFSDSKVSGTFVQLISREISQATSSLTFSPHNWILETRYSKLSRIKYQVLSLEARIDCKQSLFFSSVGHACERALSGHEK